MGSKTSKTNGSGEPDNPADVKSVGDLKAPLLNWTDPLDAWWKLDPRVQHLQNDAEVKKFVARILDSISNPNSTEPNKVLWVRSRTHASAAELSFALMPAILAHLLATHRTTPPLQILIACNTPQAQSSVAARLHGYVSGELLGENFPVKVWSNPVMSYFSTGKVEISLHNANSNWLGLSGTLLFYIADGSNADQVFIDTVLPNLLNNKKARAYWIIDSEKRESGSLGSEKKTETA